MYPWGVRRRASIASVPCSTIATIRSKCASAFVGTSRSYGQTNVRRQSAKSSASARRRARPFGPLVSSGHWGILTDVCGRYTLRAAAEEVAAHFGLDGIPELGPPRFNIAPSQEIPIVRAGEGWAEGGGADRPAPRRLALARWGLVPFFAERADAGPRTINARGETLFAKPAFREALRRGRRCLVPADGFYEWLKAGRRRLPYHVRLRGGGLFAFAGVWDRWAKPEGGALESCCIVTAEANADLRPIHDRMPVVLFPEQYDLWLDPRVRDPAALRPLLRPAPEGALVAVAVDPRVNSPDVDDPRCVEPVDRVDFPAGRDPP